MSTASEVLAKLTQSGETKTVKVGDTEVELRSPTMAESLEVRDGIEGLGDKFHSTTYRINVTAIRVCTDLDGDGAARLYRLAGGQDTPLVEACLELCGFNEVLRSILMNRPSKHFEEALQRLEEGEEGEKTTELDVPFLSRGKPDTG